MKRLLMVVSLLVLTSCGDDKVYTPDHIGQINDNTKRIELLENRMNVAEADIDSLEISVSNAEQRLSDNESDIDSLEISVNNLLSEIERIDDELQDLRDKDIRLDNRITRVRNNLNNKINRVRSSLINRIVNVRNQLRNEIAYEIDNLQIQDIDGLASALSSIRFGMVLQSGVLAYQNFRISQLNGQVSQLASDLANIQLTPGPIGPQGPQGEQGAPGTDGQDGIDGIDGQDGNDGNSNGCYVEFRDQQTYHGTVYRADVYAVCDGRAIRLVNNGSTSGSN